MEAYAATLHENVSLIESIPAQYAQEIQQAVWQSVSAGHDLHQLTETLKYRYGVTHRRAAFIATDQNNKARAVMQKVRCEELGLEYGELLHSGGGKHPRKSHLDKDRTIFKISQGFWDYAVGRYVQPGELPNCRCTFRVVINALDPRILQFKIAA